MPTTNAPTHHPTPHGQQPPESETIFAANSTSLNTAALAATHPAARYRSSVAACLACSRRVVGGGMSKGVVTVGLALRWGERDGVRPAAAAVWWLRLLRLLRERVMAWEVGRW